MYIGDLDHKDACRKGKLERSTIAEHAWNHHHPILREETSVIDEASKWKELFLKEALHIQLIHKSQRIEM